MDPERQAIIRKVYLSSIADHAAEIANLAKSLQTALRYQELTGTDVAEATRTGNLTLREANLVDRFPSLPHLIELEMQLQADRISLSQCYEVD